MPVSWYRSPRLTRADGTGTVSGVVSSSTGDALVGARVTLRETTDFVEFGSVLTGADGRFEFVDVSAGGYDLVADANQVDLFHSNAWAYFNVGAGFNVGSLLPGSYTVTFGRASGYTAICGTIRRSRRP